MVGVYLPSQKIPGLSVGVVGGQGLLQVVDGQTLASILVPELVCDVIQPTYMYNTSSQKQY